MLENLPSAFGGAQEAFDHVLARLGKFFVRSEARTCCAAYLLALISPILRKNSWQIAEEAGDTTPYGVQGFLNRHHWDPDLVRDDLRAYVVEHLGEEDGVLSGDETGFLKQGTHSAGVQRQYSGTAGHVVNCQIGVFLGYAGSRGSTLLDRALYIPEKWIANRERREEAGIPVSVAFQTKPHLLLTMIQDAVARGVPARWVVADEVYGGDGKFRRGLERLGLGYVLTIPKTHRLLPTCKASACELAQWWPEDRWVRLSAGDGSKGPRLYDWAYRTLPSAPPGYERGLLIRRSISAPEELTYFLTCAPVGTPLEKLTRVAGTRWTIETAFKVGKNEVGLDHYEVRTWTGWYRHITLAMYVMAFLTVVRDAVNRHEAESEKKPLQAIYRELAQR